VKTSSLTSLRVVACALLLLVRVVSGSDASAQPRSWKPFCVQLAVIKKTSETPGGWNNGPNDPYGLKKFAAYYSNLKRLAPSGSMVTLLTAAHPVLANPVAVARSSRKSRAAVRAMEPTVAKQCQLAVSDVFKVSVD
jgi:hypothetical protein